MTSGSQDGLCLNKRLDKKGWESNEVFRAVSGFMGYVPWKRCGVKVFYNT